MPSPLLSVIIPIRNRSGIRLENCLRSLRWQQGVPSDEVEIVLSDFGSAEDHRAAVQQAAKTFDVTVHYTQVTGLWNRSRALNIGIKRAKGKYVFCTDVDMVLAPNFFDTLMTTQKSLDGRGFLMCQYHDLPPQTEGRTVQIEDLEELKNLGTLRPTFGMGGCQCAEASWFHRVRGLDERYTYWGAEDKDLAKRAENDGRDVQWITGKTFMLHQWHPSAERDRPWLVKRNRMWYKLTSWIVRKNWLGWGE